MGTLESEQKERKRVIVRSDAENLSRISRCEFVKDGHKTTTRWRDGGKKANAERNRDEMEEKICMILSPFIMESS